MQKVSKQEYASLSKKDIPYFPIYAENTGDEVISLRQLSRKEYHNLPENGFIYIKNTDNNNRTDIDYHSVQRYKDSRSFYLNRFLDEFQNYAQQYGIITTSKELQLIEFHDNKKSPILNFENLTLNIINGTHSQNFDFSAFIERLKSFPTTKAKFKNPSLQNLNIVLKENLDEITSNDEGFFLLIMDYNAGDFEENDIYAPFNEGNYQDLYHQMKSHPVISKFASHGLCINENFYKNKDANIKVKKRHSNSKQKEWSAKEYLTYKSLKDEDLIRNFEVCLNQMYVESIQKTETQFIPHADLLENKIFAIKGIKEKVPFSKICYIENDKIKVENWNDETMQRITGRNDTLIEISKRRLTYHRYDSQLKNFTMIISKDYIWEILELPERILYDGKKLDANFQSREQLYPKYQFMSHEGATNNFSSEQIQNFNEFIANTTEIEGLCYDDLRNNSDYWNNIKTIFEEKHSDGKIKRFSEVRLMRFLNQYCDMDIHGKAEGGICQVHKGIWCDTNNQEYFVGQRGSYNSKQGQKKGFQVRKVVNIEGEFRPDDFFPLLDVEFIRYGGYTVRPYPFNVLEKFLSKK